MKQAKKGRTKVGQQSLQGLRTTDTVPGKWRVQAKVMIHEVQRNSGGNGSATGGWEVHSGIGMGRMEIGEPVWA